LKKSDNLINKKVAIVGSVGLPAKYGGWETLVDNLAFYMSDKFDLTVFCSSKRYESKMSEYKGVSLEYVNFDANGAQSIPYDIVSMIRSLKFADVIVVLGVSGCVFLPFASFFGNSKIIVNIDGLEWKRNKWNKLIQLFLKFSEKIAVKYADLVVSDNKAIQDYVFNEYGVESSLIGYGGDHASSVDLSPQSKKIHSFIGDKYAFSVCRIEPENNINIIIDAFSRFDELPLVIVGNWNNSAYGTNLREQYKYSKHIFLLDPEYDQSKLDMIRSNCHVYIHGHSAGGTNPSLVEAMYLGKAILAYDVPYNRETTLGKALYFSSSDSLVSELSLLNEGSINRVSSSMKKIADENYRWELIAAKYAELFTA